LHTQCTITDQKMSVSNDIKIICISVLYIYYVFLFQAMIVVCTWSVWRSTCAESCVNVTTWRYWTSSQRQRSLRNGSSFYNSSWTSLARRVHRLPVDLLTPNLWPALWNQSKELHFLIFWPHITCTFSAHLHHHLKSLTSFWYQVVIFNFATCANLSSSWFSNVCNLLIVVQHRMKKSVFFLIIKHRRCQ
jgi:hypothetical protein